MTSLRGSCKSNDASPGRPTARYNRLHGEDCNTSSVGILLSTEVKARCQARVPHARRGLERLPALNVVRRSHDVDWCFHNALSFGTTQCVGTRLGTSIRLHYASPLRCHPWKFGDDSFGGVVINLTWIVERSLFRLPPLLGVKCDQLVKMWADILALFSRSQPKGQAVGFRLPTSFKHTNRPHASVVLRVHALLQWTTLLFVLK